MSDNNRNIQQLARNIRKDPKDSFSKFALALELLKNNRVKEALVLFESVYKADPGYLGVYYHLGGLYQALGDSKRAEKIFLEGVRVAEEQGAARTLEELKEALSSLKEESDYGNS